MADFNTVEGWSLNFKPYIIKYTDSLSIPWFTKWTASSQLRYSLNNNVFYGEVKGYYNFEFIHYQRLGFSGGIMANQYHPDMVNPLLNSIYSLYFLDNYAKLYEKTYLNLDYSADLNTSFRVKAGFGYEHREPLVNTTDLPLLAKMKKNILQIIPWYQKMMHLHLKLITH
ncbi:MAG: hypothetical protein HC831_08525 [Chloroflexia bacterium]|nr:hypothetical protein [Chloroflexia bacterium]